MSDKKRFVQVGLGSRSQMYTNALVEVFNSENTLVGLCDSNAGRMADRAAWTAERGCPVSTYAAEQFEQMIAECHPACVIVTTQDSYHDVFICRAMELGCDGVLMNTAIAEAQQPILMAGAMKKAIEAGREAFLAGRMPRRRYASASSPETGLFF